MYKVQKRTIKKRKEGPKQGEKCAGNSKKIEGNINMSKRLTIPPGFLRTSITASTSQKDINSSSYTERKEIFEDNFPGLFNKCLNIRRSERLLKRSNQNIDGNNDLLSGSNQKNTSGELNQSGHNSIPNKGFQGVLKLNSYEQAGILNSQNSSEEKKSKRFLRRSKSIFDEINQLYASQKSKSNSFSDDFEPNSKFCNWLLKQLNKNFVFGQKTLLVCKSKFFSEIKQVESILCGKIIMEKRLPDKRNKYHYEMEDSDGEISLKHFSKSEWVYQTPPTQKIIPPRIEDNHLQPAIVYTTKKHTQIFELKPSFKPNLTNLEGKQIPINKNIKNHLVCHTLDMDMDKGPCSSQIPFVKSTNSQIFPSDCDNAFNFSQPNETDEFLNVFSRPSKLYRNENREGTQAKRKLEEDLSQGMFSSCKLTDYRKTTPEFKKNPYERNKNGFKFRIDQPISPDENEFPLMETDQLSDPVLGFDFKNMSKSAKNHPMFEFQ